MSHADPYTALQTVIAPNYGVTLVWPGLIRRVKPGLASKQVTCYPHICAMQRKARPYARARDLLEMCPVLKARSRARGRGPPEHLRQK